MVTASTCDHLPPASHHVDSPTIVLDLMLASIMAEGMGAIEWPELVSQHLKVIAE
jgi:hypothetical protein